MQPSTAHLAADAPAAGFLSGQWLKYKMTDDEGRPTIATYKILSTDGSTHQVETVMESYYSRDVTLMDFRYTPGTPLDSLEIDQVISKTGDDQPVATSDFELSMMSGVYERMVSQLFVHQVDSSEHMDVSTLAGTFEGCRERRTTLAWGPVSYKAKSWHHPAVPVHGMVKSVGVDSDRTTELVDFGLSGARSEILAVLRAGNDSSGFRF